MVQSSGFCSSLVHNPVIKRGSIDKYSGISQHQQINVQEEAAI
jgi:hypothetical protein